MSKDGVELTIHRLSLESGRKGGNAYLPRWRLCTAEWDQVPASAPGVCEG